MVPCVKGWLDPLRLPGQEPGWVFVWLAAVPRGSSVVFRQLSAVEMASLVGVAFAACVSVHQRQTKRDAVATTDPSSEFLRAHVCGERILKLTKSLFFIKSMLKLFQKKKYQ